MSDLRDTGDAWVTTADGLRYWGRYGAAGLIAHDPDRGILLQHRVNWSDHGGTWGIPGGALDPGETPLEGAFREAQEEANVPQHGVHPRFTHILDRGVWRYTTVVAQVSTPFEARITDAESHELRWVPLDAVATYPLHPAFADSWTKLHPLITRDAVLVVDAANVVGSTPNGWWNDRLGAISRLRDSFASLSHHGVSPSLFTFDSETANLIEQVYPRIIMVVEGKARTVESLPGVTAIAAENDGDDTMVSVAHSEILAGNHVTVITSDRELQSRITAVGAHPLSVGAFRRATHLP